MTDDVDAFSSRITSEKLKGVHALWREVKFDRIGPKRGEITPARLRTFMPWTFIMEVVEADFRFSFAGDRVVQFMGRPHAGTLLSALLGTPFYDGVNRFLKGAAAARAPWHMGPIRTTLAGKEHLEMEVLALPLSENGERITALLGAFETWRAGTHT